MIDSDLRHWLAVGGEHYMGRRYIVGGEVGYLIKFFVAHHQTELANSRATINQKKNQIKYVHKEKV